MLDIRLTATVAAFLLRCSRSVVGDDPAGLIGRTWAIKISDEALTKPPAWDLKSENPPVSVKKAAAMWKREYRAGWEPKV